MLDSTKVAPIKEDDKSLLHLENSWQKHQSQVSGASRRKLEKCPDRGDTEHNAAWYTVVFYQWECPRFPKNMPNGYLLVSPYELSGKNLLLPGMTLDFIVWTPAYQHWIKTISKFPHLSRVPTGTDSCLPHQTRKLGTWTLHSTTAPSHIPTINTTEIRGPI